MAEEGLFPSLLPCACTVSTPGIATGTALNLLPAHRAGTRSLMTTQGEILWFKFLTQHPGSVLCWCRSRVWYSFQPQGLPRCNKLGCSAHCSLCMGQAVGRWKMKGEGRMDFLLFGLCCFFFFFLCTAGKISLGNSRASLHFCNHCQVSDRARKPQWDFQRMQKPDAAG